MATKPYPKIKQQLNFVYYVACGRGVKHCDRDQCVLMSVCLSVCTHTHILLLMSACSSVTVSRIIN